MLKINAVGDISFEGQNRDNPSIDLFESVIPILKSGDLCIANLECPLTLLSNSTPGKCSLRGHQNWAHILRQAGIQVVSLANNHLMDYGSGGLCDTIDALNNERIYHVGAGIDRESANKPIYFDINKCNLGILARSAVQVSSPSYAGGNTPGVAFFDESETISTIKQCKQKADYVVLMIHWGLEEYCYPTPNQRDVARRLIDAGADLILGHHPHVLQGIEKISKKLVVYSLGNFVFDDIDWALKLPDGAVKQIRLKLSSRNRLGGVLKIQIKDNVITSQDFYPTKINRHGVPVPVKKERHRILDDLSKWMALPFYNPRWKIYSLIKEFELRVLPHIKGKLKLSNLHKLRLRHFLEIVKTMVRSIRILTGKSTNPYE